jgi:ubiquinone/menaquinone biosynthesis C-methylase UbiE
MKRACLAALLAASMLFACDSSGDERVMRIGPQKVALEDFAAEGYILDIGGGGEGTIGRLKGRQVIAIDISKRELEEAPEGPLKIVMDARELRFLDGTFNIVTSFFTLMYIDGVDHETVFREAHRVLAGGGRFLIWDAVIPKRPDEIKDRVVVPLTIDLPGAEVRTSYGVMLPAEDHDLAYYETVAGKAGFEIVSGRTEGSVLYLELRKP